MLYTSPGKRLSAISAASEAEAASISILAFSAAFGIARASSGLLSLARKFVGLHFVVEVFDIHLVKVESVAVGATGAVVKVVTAVEGGEGRGLETCSHCF